jgi:hypothetical protein
VRGSGGTATLFLLLALWQGLETGLELKRKTLRGGSFQL